MNDTGVVCPLYHQAVELIGRRWSGAIVRALADGAVRFGDITAAIPGLSERMLSERLKELESEGIVTRTVLPEHPVRIEYHLTEKGQDLEEVMTAIGAWAHRWLTVEIDPAPPECQASACDDLAAETIVTRQPARTRSG